MFGKLRRQTTHQEQRVQADVTSQPGLGQAPLTTQSTPGAPGQGTVPTTPAAVSTSTARTENIMLARTRTSKEVIAQVMAQRPAWTNRLPETPAAEMTTQNGEASTTGTTTEGPTEGTPGAYSVPTQPASIPSVSKGGSSWAFIDHR